MRQATAKNKKQQVLVEITMELRIGLTTLREQGTSQNRFDKVIHYELQHGTLPLS